MPVPTLTDILQSTVGNGYSKGEVEFALSAFVNEICDKRDEEKAKEEVMGVPALLKFLEPYGISESALRKWIMHADRKMNDFPCYKIGRRRFFYRSEIEPWLRLRKHQLHR